MWQKFGPAKPNGLSLLFQIAVQRTLDHTWRGMHISEKYVIIFKHDLVFLCWAIILQCVSVKVFVIRTRLSQNFVCALLEFIISSSQFPNQFSNYRLLFPNNDLWPWVRKIESRCVFEPTYHHFFSQCVCVDKLVMAVCSCSDIRDPHLCRRRAVQNER
jgi:hypothetical protein